jgi:hypothetical protein
MNVSFAAALLLRQQRAREGRGELIPSTPLGNWFAKLFAYLFAAMMLALIVRECAG